MDAAVVEAACRQGLDPADFLARCDAYHFFEPLGALHKDRSNAHERLRPPRRRRGQGGSEGVEVGWAPPTKSRSNVNPRQWWAMPTLLGCLRSAHHDLLIEEIQDSADGRRLAALQEDVELVVQVEFSVHIVDCGDRALQRELAPGRYAAVQFVEVGLTPALEPFRVALEHFFDDRIGLAIETPVEQLGRIDEKLVDRHAQPVGQAMERPGVRPVRAPGNAADRPLVQARLFGDVVDR